MNLSAIACLSLANFALLIVAIVCFISKMNARENVNINVVVDENGYLPEKAHSADAGFDLRTPESFTLPAHGTYAIDTKVHMLIPVNFCGVLISKSGLYITKHISSTGLVDSLYTGTIKVGLENHSDIDIEFKAGDKVSQIVICNIPDTTLNIVDIVEVDENARGDNGLESSGR